MIAVAFLSKKWNSKSSLRCTHQRLCDVSYTSHNLLTFRNHWCCGFRPLPLKFSPVSVCPLMVKQKADTLIYIPVSLWETPSFKCYGGLSIFHCKLLFSCHSCLRHNTFQITLNVPSFFPTLLFRKFLLSLYNYFFGSNITFSCTVVDSPCASEAQKLSWRYQLQCPGPHTWPPR